MLPALARAYELPSFSGAESVGIVRVLVLVEQPSADVKQAIKDAINWFNGAKILNISTKQVADVTGPNGYDVVIYSTPGTLQLGPDFMI